MTNELHYVIDVLPPRCSVEAHAALSPEGVVFARFRAERPRWWLFGCEQSDWSGWFRYDGEAIHLRWATFWARDE